MKIKAEIPQCFDFLFKNYPYKIAYGGRGAAKSWNYARALILKALKNKHRILCARELQNSIADSVHQLLSDQINLLELNEYFDITLKEITCRNGSIFKFKGIHHNIDEIKSFEGVTICWVEEAQNVSEDSWTKLIPTVFRTSGAELWVSFNTGYEDDSTYERFVKNPPDGAIVKLINYDENPYFPLELERVRVEDLRTRPLEYSNVWEGKPKGYGGKVWPQFIDSEYPKGHLRTFGFELIKETGNCIQVVDPAQKYYPASIHIAVFPFNQRKKWPDDFYKWVYAEYPDFQTFNDYFYKHRKSTLYPYGLSQMAASFFSKDGSGLKITNRFMDTRFAKGSGSGNYWSSETTGLIEQFAKPENGSLKFELPPVNYIDSAKNDIVKDLSWNNLIEVSKDNSAKLFVAPWCKNIRYSLFNHRVEEDSEQEAEKLKDFSDALRIGYAGLKDFKYREPVLREAKPEYAEYYGSGRDTNSWMGG